MEISLFLVLLVLSGTVWASAKDASSVQEAPPSVSSDEVSANSKAEADLKDLLRHAGKDHDPADLHLAPGVLSDSKGAYTPQVQEKETSGHSDPSNSKESR